MKSVLRRGRVHGDVVDAVADLGGGVGDVLGVEALVDGLPGCAGVVGPERARRGDGDDDALGVRAVEQDGVQAHAAGAGHPAGGGGVGAQAGELGPGCAAVGGAEERGVFHAGVAGVGVGERGLKVPDALELPRMRGAVVPLVRAGGAVVGELVVDGSPGDAAVVGALNLLAEPAGGLRGVDAVGVGGRALEVVHLPAGEVRLRDLPVLALGVSGEDEGTFLGADEEADGGHGGGSPWRAGERGI
jgi:hypothetical protein